MENKYEAHLGYLGYCGRRGAVVFYVYQHRLRRQIVVPEIVMNHLVVPDEPSAGGIERHQTIAKQILAFAVCAVEIVRGRADRKKYQTPFGIDAHHGPHICAGATLPSLAFPGFVSVFSGTRDGVEGPDKLPGADVKRPDHAAWTV